MQVVEFDLEDFVEMDKIDAEVASMTGVNRYGIASKVGLVLFVAPAH
jgi:hypothetical protein